MILSVFYQSKGYIISLTFYEFFSTTWKLNLSSDFFDRSIFLVQAWPKSGPRAKCGPWKNFVRPAGWFKFMKRIRPAIRQAICPLSKEGEKKERIAHRASRIAPLVRSVKLILLRGHMEVNVSSTEKFFFLKKKRHSKKFSFPPGPLKCSSHRMWPSWQKVWPPLS